MHCIICEVKGLSCSFIYPTMLRAVSNYCLPSSYRRKGDLVLNCQTYDYQNFADKGSRLSWNCGQHQLTEHKVTTAGSRGYYSNGQDTPFISSTNSSTFIKTLHKTHLKS